eukprot:jgi/Bigna1/141234/aug1.61_g15942
MVLPSLMSAVKELHPENEEIKQHVDNFHAVAEDKKPIASEKTRIEIAISSLLILAYVLLGGSIFMSLERQNEIDASKADGQEDREFWTYGSSVFFSLTILSTIGYGETAPQTAGGRGILVLYAIIGIPLFSYLLERISGVINRTICIVTDAGFSVFTTAHKPYVHGRAGEFNFFSSTVLSTTLIVALFGGAFLFVQGEGWTYFSFVTLSSIGFGDFVPTTDNTRALTSLFIICFMGSLSEILTAIQTALGNFIKRLTIYFKSPKEESDETGKRNGSSNNNSKKGPATAEEEEKEPGGSHRHVVNDAGSRIDQKDFLPSVAIARADSGDSKHGISARKDETEEKERTSCSTMYFLPTIFDLSRI